jgi:TPR repeat protein
MTITIAHGAFPPGTLYYIGVRHMHTFSTRRSVVLALALVLCRIAARGGEPGEDLFQKGVAAFQSGDMTTALKLFMQAAQAGHTQAAGQVGWCYETGTGVRQDLTRAADWYRKAAEKGNSRAQKNLGALYEDGRGVPQDWVEAAKWYQKSAAQNDSDGEATLARAYQFGIGVPQSRSDTLYWDRRAAAHGDSEAAYFVRWLSSPTNNIGFRNAAERNVVIGFRMVDMIVLNEPAGRVFHNSAERNAYLLGVARRLDGDEAYSRWWLNRAEYTQCMGTRHSGCRDPGPAPR